MTMVAIGSKNVGNFSECHAKTQKAEVGRRG